MSTTTDVDYDVAIIGGGVGGLALAVALNSQGVDAHVFEQWPDFGEVGGHLTVDNSAIGVLDDFGLGQPFRDAATELKGLEIRGIEDGQVRIHMRFPDLAAMGVKGATSTGGRVAWGFLRSDLVRLFATHVAESQLHTGRKAVSIVDGDDAAEVTFDSGETIRANLVIGADGVRSLVRQMFDDAPSSHAGVTICRVNAPADKLPAGHANDRLRLWDGGVVQGQGSVALTCPVRGGTDVAIDVLFVGGGQLEDVDKQDVPVGLLVERLPDGVDPLLLELLEHREGPIVAHGLYDREVASTWSGKRVTILGDAAHAMRPNLGQGACQSIHDAGELSRAIAELGSTTAALERYESVRKPYVTEIVRVSKLTPPTPESWDDDVKVSSTEE